MAARNSGRDTIYVNANPKVADMLYGEEVESMERVEGEVEKRIVVRAMGHYHLEKFEVYAR